MRDLYWILVPQIFSQIGYFVSKQIWTEIDTHLGLQYSLLTPHTWSSSFVSCEITYQFKGKDRLSPQTSMKMYVMYYVTNSWSLKINKSNITSSRKQ